MKNVFITSSIPEAGLSLLRDKFNLHFYDGEGQITEQELQEAAQNHHALITILSDPVTKQVLEAGDQLEIVANYGAGVNNIDTDAAKDRGVRVTNTPGVLHKTTADLAFSLLMGAARRIVEADDFLRQGKFCGWRPDLLLGTDIHEKTLGIIGLGEIGTEMANRASGFNMKVLYHKPTPLSQEKEWELNITYASMEEILRNSDFISIHVPLTDRTHHLITLTELKLMKNTAILINTSRGAVIKEDDLVEGLKQGEILGCGLDVFEEEPKVHPELLERSDCILLPHIGSATESCRDEMARVTCQNVVSVLVGDEPKTPVV